MKVLGRCFSRKMVSIASLNGLQTARPDIHSFGRSLKSSARKESTRAQSSVGSATVEFGRF